MTKEIVTKIATEMKRHGWTSKFEISGHGEPSINPDKVELVKILRTHLPKNQIAMITNGSGFMDVNKIYDMFDAGLNILTIDDYADANYVSKIRARLDTSIKTIEYPSAGLGESPHRRHPPTTKLIFFVEDLFKAEDGVHSKINSRAGDATPDTPVVSAQGKRCVKPFRDMVIRWDGSVNSCCEDNTGRYKIANVLDMSVYDVWQHPRFQALRTMLYHGQRTFSPCSTCSFVGMRPGLLPDKMGKETLSLPTDETLRLVAEATAGDPYSKRVVWINKG
jgi:radical SAM protein with 4Fe4S-binding SPASM domain